MIRDEWQMQMMILTHEESDAEHYNAALHTLEAWDIAQRMKIEQQAKEIERLQAQLATANERVTRMRSLLQRAQSIIALDADLYTIWREDAVEELAK